MLLPAYFMIIVAMGKEFSFPGSGGEHFSVALDWSNTTQALQLHYARP